MFCLSLLNCLTPISLPHSCKAREAVKTRNQVRLTVSQKQQQAKEEHLRQLAQKAREDRAGIRTAVAGRESCDQALAVHKSFSLHYSKQK